MKLNIPDMALKQKSFCIWNKHLSETFKLYFEHKNLILIARGFTEHIAAS